MDQKKLESWIVYVTCLLTLCVALFSILLSVEKGIHNLGPAIIPVIIGRLIISWSRQRAIIKMMEALEVSGIDDIKAVALHLGVTVEGGTICGVDQKFWKKIPAAYQAIYIGSLIRDLSYQESSCLNVARDYVQYYGLESDYKRVKFAESAFKRHDDTHLIQMLKGALAEAAQQEQKKRARVKYDTARQKAINDGLSAYGSKPPRGNS